MPESVDAREQRWAVTVDGDGNLRGIGDKTGSVPPAVVKRTGLRVIDVVPAARLAEVERERDEFRSRVTRMHEALRRESVRSEMAFRERDEARAALERAREALEEIARLDRRSADATPVEATTGVTMSWSAQGIARAALDALPVPTETTAEETPAQRVSRAAGNALARIDAGVYGPTGEETER